MTWSMLSCRPSPCPNWRKVRSEMRPGTLFISNAFLVTRSTPTSCFLAPAVAVCRSMSGDSRATTSRLPCSR
jgi:hypothetical protein